MRICCAVPASVVTAAVLLAFVPASAGTKSHHLAWTELIGTDSSDSSRSVAVDSSDNVYISGTTEGDLDGETNQGDYDAFLIKYDSDGNKQWTELIGTTNWDSSRAVAVDSSGYVYISGYTEGDLDGETNQGDYDAFLTKYDSDGNKQWTQLIGSDSSDRSQAVAVDSSGYVYISGYTEGDFDGYTNAGPILDGSEDAFLTKYDSDGNKQWTKLIGVAGEDESYAVAVDSSDNVYIGGTTHGALDGETYVNSADAFLTKYDSDGNRQWTELIGTIASEYTRAIVVDSSGNVYISGDVRTDLDGETNQGDYDAFLIKYDSDGNKQWTELTGSSDWEYGFFSIAVDSSGNVYGSGWNNGDLNGETYHGGFNDAFLVKYELGIVPEPATAALVLLGAGGLMCRRRAA